MMEKTIGMEQHMAHRTEQRIKNLTEQGVIMPWLTATQDAYSPTDYITQEKNISVAINNRKVKTTQALFDSAITTFHKLYGTQITRAYLINQILTPSDLTEEQANTYKKNVVRQRIKQLVKNSKVITDKNGIVYKTELYNELLASLRDGIDRTATLVFRNMNKEVIGKQEITYIKGIL